MGKWWFLMGFDGDLPNLVMTFTVCKLENHPVEIVDFPMKHGGFRYVSHYQVGYPKSYPTPRNRRCWEVMPPGTAPLYGLEPLELGENSPQNLFSLGGVCLCSGLDEHTNS